MRTLTAGQILSIYRLVIGEAGRLPELAAWVKARMEADELRRGDCKTAARYFIGLCQADAYQLALLGLRPSGWDDHSAADVDEAVRIFCIAWRLEGARPGG